MAVQGDKYRRVFFCYILVYSHSLSFAKNFIEWIVQARQSMEFITYRPIECSSYAPKITLSDACFSVERFL